MVSTTVYLEAEVLGALRRVGKESGRGMAWWVRRGWALALEEAEALPRCTGPCAPGDPCWKCRSEGTVRP
jgi:hypothetical protein